MKILFRCLFLVLFLGLLPYSCDKDNCGDLSPQNFSIEEMQAVSILTNGDEPKPDSSYSFDLLLIQIIATKTKTIASNSPDFWHFNQRLWACSPVPPRPVNPVNSIRVISNADFSYNNHSFQTGADISQLFFIEDWNSGSDSTLITNDYPHDHARLKLLEAPEREVVLTFEVRVGLKDGKEFRFEELELAVLAD